MEIPPPDLRTQAAAPPAALSDPASRAADMPVEAVVTALRKMPSGMAGAGYLLELDAPGFEHRFEASSTRALEPGSRLVIRFIDHERARVEQVLERPRSPASPASSQALREALPRQQPVAEAYAGIARLLLQGSLPPEIRRHIDRLLQSLPSPESLSSGSGLREALENSGTFLESRLLRAPASPARAQDTSGEATASLSRSPGTGAMPLSSGAGTAQPQQTGQASAATTALSRLLRFFASLAPSLQAASPNVETAPPRAPDTRTVSAPPSGAETLARRYDSRGLPDAPRTLPGQPTTLAASTPAEAISALNPTRGPDSRLVPPELGTPPKTAAPAAAQSSGALNALAVSSFAAASNTPQPARAPTSEGAASAIPNRAAPPTALHGRQAANPAPGMPGSEPAARALLYEANAAHQQQLTNQTQITAASLIATPLAIARRVRGPADNATTPGMPESTALPRSATQLQTAPRETANFSNAPDKTGNAPYPRASESIPTGRTVAQALTKTGEPASLIPATGEIDSAAHTNEGADVPRTSAPAPRGGAAQTTPPTPPPAAVAARGEAPISGAAPRQPGTPPIGQPEKPGEQERGRENLPANRLAPALPPLLANPGQRHVPTPVMQDLQLRADTREPGSVAGFASTETAPGLPSRAQADGNHTNGSRVRAPELPGRALNGETRAQVSASSPLRSDLKAALSTLQGLLNQGLPPIPTSGMPRAGNAAEPLSVEDPDSPVLYTARGFLGAVVDQQGGTPRADRRHHGTREQRSGEMDAVAQLLRYVDGALARTRVHQLASLPELRSTADAASNTSAWVMELPIASPKGFDSLWMRLEEQGSSARASDAATRKWRVMLCLDCAELGPLHARVELSGNRLGATLWAEREGTLQAARAAVGELEAALRTQGVEVSRVDCLHGRPPESTGLRFGNLLDVRT